ncbi:MAG TPA: hypothetical protein VHM48_12135 [Candidatus Limnocylindrales bacterium]|nr:hypothetical protein [Candidatus Limnocylindrales bacterium]
MSDRAGMPHAAATMPVDLIAFTADRRIHGAIPLADDRLSDMLNSVARIVIRGAVIEDLIGDAALETADLTLAVGSIVAVLVEGRRGIDSRRRKTEVHRARVGLTRFVVSGSLHVPIGAADRLAAGNPAAVFVGRDILVPLTDATITYDKADVPTTEHFETILVNRAHVTWVDLDGAAGSDDSDLVEERPKVYHASIVKDFTRAT